MPLRVVFSMAVASKKPPLQSATRQAEKIQNTEYGKRARSYFGDEAKHFFRRWALTEAPIETLTGQPLKVYEQTLQLYESDVSPWMRSASLPWIDVDPNPALRIQIIGVSPKDVSDALKKERVHVTDEIVGQTPIQMRVAFLAAKVVVTPLKNRVVIDLCPKQLEFYERIERPDLLTRAQSIGSGGPELLQLS